MQPSVAQIFGDAQDDPALRIQTLDGIRGIAVMGILAMNIIAFAMPFPAYINPAAYGGTTGADFVAWLLSFILVDGKMRTLFSLLFGASMWLVIAQAERKGESGRATHFWRMLFLLMFGLIHYYLIWMGDILALYALCGMLAYPLIRRTSRSLVKIAIALFVVQFFLWALVAGSIHMVEIMGNAPNADPAMVRTLADMRAGLMGPESPDIARELAAFGAGGSYATAFAFRTGPDYLFGPLFMLLQFGLETIALMLLGAALLKNGLLKGDWDDRDARRLAIRLALPAIIGLVAAAIVVVRSGFDTVTTFTTSMIWTMPFDTLLGIAYAPALVIWLKPRLQTPLVQRIVAAGRAAFTNYLGTSIIMTTLFYGYGFGLFGLLGRVEIYGVVAVMCALMLLWSKPWLARHAYGPLEWLWRTLARREVQPWQKAQAS